MTSSPSSNQHARAHGELWVVTSYFNPGQYQTRYANYLLFREGLERIGVPCLTVECAFGADPFALALDRNVLQVRARDVMWQKERLLNLAIAHLPDSCTKVAWVDCDVLFENVNWVGEACVQLETYPIVQLFERAVRLPRGQTQNTGEGISFISYASMYRTSPHLPLTGSFVRHGHTGFAWAARRDLLLSFGLYDTCILGSGDHMMAHAFCGDWDTTCARRILGLNTPHQRHYALWSRKIYNAVCARISYVPGTILHLWHGEKRDRYYVVRNRYLSQQGFDPVVDLRLSAGGVWEWNSEKVELHAFLEKYFYARNEDGGGLRENHSPNWNEPSLTHPITEEAL